MEKSALVYVFLTLGTVGFALLIKNRDSLPAYKRQGYGAGQWQPLSRQQARNCVAEFVIYCLMAGVSACRFALGNDYWVYRENFRRIFYDAHVSSELGFNLTVKGLFHLFGYDNYLPVFAFFSLVTVFFFVRALHDQSENFAFSLFLLMTGGYYFQSLNTIRYYLVLAVALYSIKYVLQGQFGKFILMILVCATFHKTVLLTIPAYLLAYYLAHRGIKKWHWAAGGVFLASLIFGQDLYRLLIFKLYPYYENTSFDVGRVSYVNIAKCVGGLALYGIVWFLQKKDGMAPLKENQRFYFVLNVFGLLAFCCGSFVPEVSRIGYYMIAPQIFLIPGLVDSMKKGWIRTFCKWGCIVAFALYFGLLLKQMYQNDVRLLPYMSWIFYYK